MKKFTKGFSLIELMIVVAIIGILSTIAIPSYKTYILKARVSEVYVAARTVQVQMEQLLNLNVVIPNQATNINSSALSDLGITLPKLPSIVNFFYFGNMSDGGKGFAFSTSIQGIAGPFIPVWSATTTTDGSIVWKCGVDTQTINNGNNRYANANCQNFL